MGEPAGRMIVVTRSGVVEVPASRSAHAVRLEDSVAWWGSLAVLGASLVVLGLIVGAALGSAAAIGGFVLFLATAVLVGDERYEVATAMGISGVIWTSAGISVSLGTDPSLVGSLVGFEIVGVLGLVVGVPGILRARVRRPSTAGRASSPG